MKIKTDNADVAIVVGRFQVAELHEAHKELIDSVKSLHQRVIIVLGLSNVIGTQSNPLGFEPRRQMIQEEYPDIDIVYLKDYKSDKVWSKKLDEIVHDLIGPNQTAVLYGSRDSFIKYYSGKLPTLELVATKVVSGSEIRERLAKKATSSYDWRAGAIWQAFNQFRKVYPTVDAAIQRDGKILFVKKPNEDNWRFPGGFADINSFSYEDDAIREAKEETGLTCTNPVYIGSFKIDDWRYKDGIDCIKSILFLMDAPNISESAEVADDLKGGKCAWFNLNDLEEMNIEKEHVILFRTLKEYKNKQKGECN